MDIAEVATETREVGWWLFTLLYQGEKEYWEAKLKELQAYDICLGALTSWDVMESKFRVCHMLESDGVESTLVDSGKADLGCSII